jgi:hypothetical protein
MAKRFSFLILASAWMNTQTCLSSISAARNTFGDFHFGECEPFRTLEKLSNGIPMDRESRSFLTTAEFWTTSITAGKPVRAEVLPKVANELKAIDLTAR